MKFIAGISGNPKGRPKLSGAAKSKEIQEFVRGLVLSDKEALRDTYKSLGGQERLRFFIAMAPYLMPKLSSVEMATEFNQMTDEQLDKVIEQLKKAGLKVA